MPPAALPPTALPPTAIPLASIPGPVQEVERLLRLEFDGAVSPEQVTEAVRRAVAWFDGSPVRAGTLAGPVHRQARAALARSLSVGPTLRIA